MTSMDKASLIRIIVFLFAWLNQYLVAKGEQPLPFIGEEEVAALLTFAASIWTTMKDNRVKKNTDEQSK